MVVKVANDITRNICHRKQAKQVSQRHPICMNDSDHDHIFGEINSDIELSM